MMFRVKVQSESRWRGTRKIPVLNRLVRLDLRSIIGMKSPETIDLAFSQIDLLSGVSKETNKERFREVDDRSVQIILGRSLSSIHDVGVSSGITSLELMRRLRAASFAGEMFISDKFARFWVSRKGLSTDILDADHRLICTYWGPIAGDSEDTWKFPLSKLIFQRALKRGFNERSKESFLLFHPEVMEAIEGGELSYIEFDVFESGREGEFDYIRCMNLLNLGYFSHADIVKGLEVLYGTLAVGGVLQLGRTHAEGENHVTFYEKTGTGLQRIESIGQGSEIDRFAMDIG